MTFFIGMFWMNHVANKQNKKINNKIKKTKTDNPHSILTTEAKTDRAGGVPLLAQKSEHCPSNEHLQTEPPTRARVWRAPAMCEQPQRRWETLGGLVGEAAQAGECARADTAENRLG